MVEISETGLIDFFYQLALQIRQNCGHSGVRNCIIDTSYNP